MMGVEQSKHRSNKPQSRTRYRFIVCPLAVGNLLGERIVIYFREPGDATLPTMQSAKGRCFANHICPAFAAELGETQYFFASYKSLTDAGGYRGTGGRIGRIPRRRAKLPAGFLARGSVGITVASWSIAPEGPAIGWSRPEAGSQRGQKRPFSRGTAGTGRLRNGPVEGSVQR
jgi:hypothetical protein